MTLTIHQKTLYGRTLLYPDCDASRTLALLAGVKSFTVEQLKLAKALGFSVTVHTGQGIEL